MEDKKVDYVELMRHLFDQVFDSKQVPNERPMTVYIDIEYNSTSLNALQTKYVINSMKTMIQEQFSLLSPLALILFPIIYGLIVLCGN